MGHYFVLIILPEEFRSTEDKERIEDWISQIMTPHFSATISGEINEQGFCDSYEIGGRFDGAINGLPNYYFEALETSRSNPDKDYGLLFRRLASEEMKRNSCKVDQIKFPSGTEVVLPEKVVFPDGTVKGMPAWFLSPDFVRTADGKLREISVPFKRKPEAEASRHVWDEDWTSIVKKYGDRFAVALDCHV